MAVRAGALTIWRRYEPAIWLECPHCSRDARRTDAWANWSAVFLAVATVVAQIVGANMNFVRAMAIVEEGFEAWAAKEHNRKWLRRIDGTPIRNDLSVCIATEIMRECISVKDQNS